jgi:hypothetical protein
LHGSNPEPLMSALGQKQTSEHVQLMSALPPKADINDAMRNVPFVPKADILHRSKKSIRGTQNNGCGWPMPALLRKVLK